MLNLELTQVGFGVQKHPDGRTILGFKDAESGILVTIPFDDASWANFSKAVAGARIHIADPGDLEKLKVPGRG